MKRLLLIIFLLAFARPVYAQKLPVRRYGLAEGLPHETVARIVADSRGYIWFCTRDGLSRFDGERFTNYGVNDGLPVAAINDLLEARDGSYWIATRGEGVALFNPDIAKQSGKRGGLFKVYSLGSETTSASNFVSSLYEDRQGGIWASTNGGLFRLNASDRSTGGFRRVELKLATRPDAVTEAHAVVEDREGSIWVATVWGLVRLLPSGHITQYSVHPTADDVIFAMTMDEKNCLWLAHRNGLFVFTPDSIAEAEIFRDKTRRLPNARSYTRADGLPNNQILAVAGSKDGHIWLGTSFGGLAEFDGQRFRTYGARQGLSDRISNVTADRAGNIWVGTPDRGAMKITKDGLISFSEEEGFIYPEVIQIDEGSDGELYVISAKWSIHRYTNDGFVSVRPNLPQHIVDSSSGRWWIIRDKKGEWWVSTIEGLYRFPKVKRFEDLAHASPLAVYTKRDGLPDNNINRLFEDSRGDIWISSYNPPSLLTRWERATATFHVYSGRHGMPSLNWTNVFSEDAMGNVWLGFHNGGLGRYRQDRIEVFTDGVPAGIIQGLYHDRSGSLWIAASSGGAARMDEPAASKPSLTTYTAEHGLSSNNLRSFVQDSSGRIYFGTAKGVDRLDPATGRLKHYTRADGLIASEVTAAFADRKGRLWFGTREGISMLVPSSEDGLEASQTLIAAISIDGMRQPLSELGEQNVSGIEVTPEQNGIQIEVVSPNAGAGAARHQYRLEGVDGGWNAPSEQRSISYAHLSPGRYRFLARAVNREGLPAQATASVTFTVLPPIWRRWWFLASVALALGSAIYGAHRYQVRRLLEVERVRIRIATDLHDDIGLNLSRMVILSEVVKQQIGRQHQDSVQRLNEIADSARALVDSMSDIVWSIDPRRDDLNNLLLRIRQFGGDVFEAKGIDWDFQTKLELEKVKLDAEQRRQILLIVKEAVNNIARHAACTRAAVAITAAGNLLTAEIRDDGRGFSDVNADGNGLKNMRNRAQALRGRLEVSSTPGKGTTVTLILPVK